ncbi:MAG: type IV pilus biogenesis/stability protein PilW [Comamonadaceae bacterium CG1_02_60_18]|nr:MAG: type IV pilus biogenesis/stability protein PilW [Comamonadaceae bacterium CG1_02_60_18]PIQ54933.1 MAG: type IV pilus biogenesis/stability protein PilW [Comamonadaceae bacterium CG12_big_fil_rev_8_21_14_0_65_59_15]
MKFLTVLLTALSACLALLVGACANNPQAGASAGVSADRMTESDESPERKRARIRVELALGYFEQGKTTIALDEIKQAIATDPTFSEAFSLRGLIYMRLNEYAIAEDSFKRALALNPRDSNVLHNLGWLKCQVTQYPQSVVFFEQALSDPLYAERAKTYMALGLCQVRAGNLPQAEAALMKSYEYDAGNPVTGYNLANLLYQKNQDSRARFYIRRINNSALANAETLWLGIKIERRLGDQASMSQLGSQLIKRFPESKQTAFYQRGAFDE